MVAPFVGAWIEMFDLFNLKEDADVAPFVGAWIEIKGEITLDIAQNGRSVRRSVD